MTTLWEIAETVRAEEFAAQQNTEPKVSSTSIVADDRLDSPSTKPFVAKANSRPRAFEAPGPRPRMSSWSLSELREPYTPGLP